MMQETAIRIEKVVSWGEWASVHAANVFAHSQKGVRQSDFATQGIAIGPDVGGQNNSVISLEEVAEYGPIHGTHDLGVLSVKK
jgi:hypothetical protein